VLPTKYLPKRFTYSAAIGHWSSGCYNIVCVGECTNFICHSKFLISSCIKLNSVVLNMVVDILYSLINITFLLSYSKLQNMFDFNTTLNLCSYLALFVPQTPLVVWYFITDLISPKVHGYFALFESKSAVIFIFVHCLIIFFKLCKFTWTLHGVFPSPNRNSYVVFH